MKDYCKRGGYCEFRLVGGVASENGIAVRVCVNGGEVKLTDRVALGLPAQPVIGRFDVVSHLEEMDV